MEKLTRNNKWLKICDGQWIVAILTEDDNYTVDAVVILDEEEDSLWWYHPWSRVSKNDIVAFMNDPENSADGTSCGSFENSVSGLGACVMDYIRG